MDPDNPGPDKIRSYLMKNKMTAGIFKILRSRIVHVHRALPAVSRLLCSVRHIVSDCEAQIRSVSDLEGVLEYHGTPTSRLRLGDLVLTRKAKSELFSALFKLHHLANCMYHRLEENEAKRSSLLPFEGSQI